MAQRGRAVPQSVPRIGRIVLFHENPNTHRELYVQHVIVTTDTLTGRQTTKLITTRDVRDAVWFHTTAGAYAFGTNHGLDIWRVGRR